MANGSKNTTEEAPKKTTAKTAAKEEVSGGTVAVIIALVAIIVIAGSVGAFYLFLKLKKDYLTPKAPAVTPSELVTADNLSGETSPVGIGDTTPFAPPPAVPTTPTIPEVPVPPVTPTPELPKVPEPEKVGSYDFDGAISNMDGTMNQTYDTTFNNSIYSNDYFGF